MFIRSIRNVTTTRLLSERQYSGTIYKHHARVDDYNDKKMREFSKNDIIKWDTGEEK